jgi:hypothetical protein
MHTSLRAAGCCCWGSQQRTLACKQLEAAAGRCKGNTPQPVSSWMLLLWAAATHVIMPAACSLNSISPPHCSCSCRRTARHRRIWRLRRQTQSQLHRRRHAAVAGTGDAVTCAAAKLPLPTTVAELLLHSTPAGGGSKLLHRSAVRPLAEAPHTTLHIREAADCCCSGQLLLEAAIRHASWVRGQPAML